LFKESQLVAEIITFIVISYIPMAIGMVSNTYAIK